MVDIPGPAEIRARVERAGATMAQLCELARIHPTTAFRWERYGQSPNLRTLRRVLAALERIERNRLPRRPLGANRGC